MIIDISMHVCTYKDLFHSFKINDMGIVNVGFKLSCSWPITFNHTKQ